MITKDDLKNYYKTQQYINIQREQIDLLKIQTGSRDLDGMPKGKGYKENYRLEELLDKEQELLEKNFELLMIHSKILDILNSVSPSNRLILTKRYILGKKARDIADDEDLSEDRVNHLIGYALSEFEQKISESGVNNIQ